MRNGSTTPGSGYNLRCPLWVISGHVQCKTAYPLYPRKRTLAVHKSMSTALGQKQTLAQRAITPVSKIQKDHPPSRAKGTEVFMAQPLQ
jgi:hypothetical protein